MRAPLPQRPMTLAEYLAFEEASPLRHECVAGQVHAMTGATLRHNIIGGNVFARLRARSSPAARAGRSWRGSSSASTTARSTTPT